MDMDMSATFFAGSILVMLGFVVIIAGIVLINNIFHNYWKPVKIFWPSASPYEESGDVKTYPMRSAQQVKEKDDK
jgi:uncharacterized membrane protein